MEQIQAETKWKSLYRIAGFAAIAMLVIIPVQILVFVVTPIPVSIESWFSLFHNNWLLGLIHQDMLYIFSNLLVAVMYLGLYIALRPKNESLMTVALMLGLLGIAAYLASNKSFELLGISNQYYSARTETQQYMLLAAGQALLSGWQGTSFLIYYILNGITLVLIACVMLKSLIFRKTTAIIGLIAGLLMMVPSTAGSIGLVFSLVSLIPWYVFSILIARRFLQMSKQ